MHRDVYIFIFRNKGKISVKRDRGSFVKCGENLERELQ